MTATLNDGYLTSPYLATGDEEVLFRAAHAYEQAMPWRKSRPALAVKVAA